MIQLKIIYKYDPRRAILLDPKGESIKVLIDAHPKVEDFNGYYKFKGINKWVKGIDLDE